MQNTASYSLPDEAMPAEVRFGYWAIAAFLTALLLWAALTPLATGVIAIGVVSVEGSSKMVQHLSGGLVEKIVAKEGELVSKGTLLISLDEKPLQSRLDALTSQYVLLIARKSRLKAESLAHSKVVYSGWLVQQENQAEVMAAINNQDQIFQSGLAQQSDIETTYRHRISQARTQINSEQSRLFSTGSRERMVSAELNKYQQLLAQGLVTRNEIYSLDNAYRQIQDTRESLRGSIGTTQGLISQYKAELSESKMTKRSQASIALDALQDQLTSVGKDLSVTQDLLEQTQIRAPISGYIVKLMANTVGGVIAPGATIMEIIPNDKELIIKANVNTKDRISIESGQSAEVRFSAFSSRSTQPIKGKVTVVSADRLMDPMTNIPYYSTDIILTEDPSIKLSGETIHPGMQAEVIISTGERTTLNYLISPLTASFNRALRED